jgi:hypothetical protein
MSVVMTKRNWTSGFWAMIESGIWTLKVSQTPEFGIFPVNEAMSIHSLPGSLTCRRAKSNPASRLSRCLKPILTGEAAPVRST